MIDFFVYFLIVISIKSNLFVKILIINKMEILLVIFNIVEYY